MDIEALRLSARQIRKDIALMTYRAHSSHIGSCYSIVDILALLYGKILNLRPGMENDPQRDIFILSKGHAVAALYATLAYYEFFERELLDSYETDGGILFGHPVRGTVPGVELTSGSLGHGLAQGAGLALAKKLDKYDGQIYVLMGDGECNEGSVWEAALVAAHLNLDNLTVLIDRNQLQGFGKTEDVARLEPFLNKWQAFGFHTEAVNGHDFTAMSKVLGERVGGRPRALVLNTVKGKGVSFMEDSLAWHYKSLNEGELELALKEIELNEDEIR